MTEDWGQWRKTKHLGEEKGLGVQSLLESGEKWNLDLISVCP